MKVKLATDFLDYYDHHFDREGQIFPRFTNDGRERLTTLMWLRSRHLHVPVFGRCSHMQKDFSPKSLVVVHLDELAHCGDGKILVTYHEALKLFPNCLVVEYLAGEIPGLSFRYLSIGKRTWLLEYRSKNDWRSSCGEVDISIKQELDSSKAHISSLPLFAIDFVKDSDIFYAIDFNSAPGLKYTGLDSILKPAQVVELIKEKIYVVQNRVGGLGDVGPSGKVS